MASNFHPKIMSVFFYDQNNVSFVHIIRKRMYVIMKSIVKDWQSKPH